MINNHGVGLTSNLTYSRKSMVIAETGSEDVHLGSNREAICSKLACDASKRPIRSSRKGFSRPDCRTLRMELVEKRAGGHLNLEIAQ
jgi:hypothetical protein